MATVQGGKIFSIEHFIGELEAILATHPENLKYKRDRQSQILSSFFKLSWCIDDENEREMVFFWNLFCHWIHPLPLSTSFPCPEISNISCHPFYRNNINGELIPVLPEGQRSILAVWPEEERG